MQNHLSQQMDLLVGILCENKQEIEAPFFLPFNLSLTLDGISGIKIYEKFYMTEDILPPSYNKTRIDLVIKAVNHTISPTTWDVQLETIAAPRNPNVKSSTKPTKLKGKLGSSPPTSGGGGPYAIKYFDAKLPEDPKLRLKHTRLLDDGLQTLGVFDILAEDESTILYSLCTVELPWKNNLTCKSCIPAPGPDTKWAVTSRANSKYGKHFFPQGYVQTEKGWYIPGTNHSPRTYCLIHRSPIAPGWLMGCIGPGFYFNSTQKYSNGNPKGMGSKYRDPAAQESFDALQKMVGTLYDLGGFYMTIEALNPVTSGTSVKPGATSIKDPAVMAFLTMRVNAGHLDDKNNPYMF